MHRRSRDETRRLAPPPLRGLRWLVGLLALVATLPAAELREATLAELMPLPGDHTLLSWREGPPYTASYRREDATAARYSPERRFLRLHTGTFAAEIDTEQIRLTGLDRLATPVDADTALRQAQAAEPLLPAELRLSIRTEAGEYVCRGRRPLALTQGLPARPLEFPVQVIESGRYFQKILLGDLEFTDAAGRRLPLGRAHLEIAAWPDRLAFTLVTRADALPAQARVALRLALHEGRRTAEHDALPAWRAGGEHRATLVWSAQTPAKPPAAPAGVALQVTRPAGGGAMPIAWSEEEAGYEVELHTPAWPTPEEGGYPESHLDAYEDFPVTLANASDAPALVPLLFDHQPPKALTGFVPMLVDAAGRPTGLPVQASKNWHIPAPPLALPYGGLWIHGRAWLRLPPRSRATLRYAIAYARWGGVPTASLAQLSLVGWGHNGFWDQLALGSFGESLCFQPARALRRALLTDLRPLHQRGFAQGARWDWTTNVGGADTLVRHDARGRYVPAKGHGTRHLSPGPNLAHLAYEELSDDLAIRSRIEVLLPRGDDHVRAYLRIRYEVLRRAEFTHLALFQLGADFYNDADSPAVAWGSAGSLGAEVRPTPRSGQRLLPPVEATGPAPWVSLHGQAPVDLAPTGQAVRGLIVREWRATLGGVAVPAPWLAVVGSRSSRSRLAVEIAPPPGLAALLPGDRVEMLLELVALPLAPERYYGPDAALRAALEATPNAWPLVAREAAQNRPTLRPAGGAATTDFPLTLALPAEGEAAFALAGGLGWVPVRLTGLPRPGAVALHRIGPAGREPVTQGPAGRAYWQTDYDPATRRWSVTYNLPAPSAAERAAEYVFAPAAAASPAPAGRPAEAAAARR